MKSDSITASDNYKNQENQPPYDSNYSNEQERKVYEGIEYYSNGRLWEAQVNKIRLLNSLFKIQKFLNNPKECTISALVYLDKLHQSDDKIPSSNLNW